MSFRGEIDASDIDHVTAFAVRSALMGDALLLDTRDVEFFAVQGISLLNAVEKACRGLDLPWILVASSAVERVLRVSGQADALPMANSIHAAMQYFAYISFLAAHPRSVHDLPPTRERTSDQSR
ncbi:STAS domain-containing protein [Mycobacterium sp.]|uniref:STAS domain-containing protein n=1 Tax=Mycobacterium sp. TaxID=1785 RepID=UPI003D1531C2